MTQEHPYKEQTAKITAGPRAIALVGPHGGGKTTLLESIAMITGAVQRKGSVATGSSLGDSSPQSRARQMSVEMNVLTTNYLGEEFTFLDCPGSIEFLADTLNLLSGIDAAVVVCEPDAAKVTMLQPYLKRLAEANIPHMLFINKIDKAHGPVRALHERIAERIRAAKIVNERARFTFTPHCTLNLYRELPAEELRSLLAVRFAVPVRVEAIQAYRATSTSTSRQLFALPLAG